jgi:MFS family permease
VCESEEVRDTQYNALTKRIPPSLVRNMLTDLEADEKGTRALPRNVKILGWTSFLNDVASEMIYPLLPDFFLHEIKGTKTLLGVLDGLAESVASVLKLYSGGWSDWAGGRKRLILFGYSLAAIARPLLAIATVPWQVLAMRIGDRIGKGIRTSPRDAMIADSTLPEQRGWAFGFHRGMDHAGAALGPLLAMLFLWLCPGQFRWLFAITLVPGVLVLACLKFGLKEVPVATSATARPQLSLKPFDGNFRLYLLTLLIFAVGNSSDMFLLVRAGELGVPVLWTPALWFVFHMAKSGGTMLFGRGADRWGAKRSIVLGWLVYAFVYLGFGFASQAWHAWVLFLGYALFYALTEPAEKKLVSEIVGAEHRGLGFGWFHFIMGIGTLPASVLFGWLYDSAGTLAAFGWGAALAMVSAVMLLFVKTTLAPLTRSVSERF